MSVRMSILGGIHKCELWSASLFPLQRNLYNQNKQRQLARPRELHPFHLQQEELWGSLQHAGESVLYSLYSGMYLRL